MRSITRMIAAGALSIPLALAAAGMAFADTSSDGPYSVYVQEATAAGPEGASTYFVYSEAGYGHHHGYYEEDCDDDCETNYHHHDDCEEECKPTYHHHDDCDDQHYDCEDDCDDECEDDDDDDDGLLGNFLSDLV